MSTTAGKHKAGDSVLFDRLVDDWLMALAGLEMTAWVNRYALGALEVPVQCIRCPPLSTIKADLKVRKRLTFAPVVVEGDDDAEIRHQIGQVFRDMIEAGVEGAVPLFDSDETIEGVPPVLRRVQPCERGCGPGRHTCLTWRRWGRSQPSIWGMTTWCTSPGAGCMPDDTRRGWGASLSLATGCRP